MSNPLLDTSSLPRFDEIRPEHVLPAVRKVIADQRAELDQLLSGGQQPDIDALVAPVEHMGQQLGRIWSPVSHLQSVLGSKEWREAYKQALPLYETFVLEFGKSPAVPYALLRVGRCHHKLARRNQAVKAYQEVLEKKKALGFARKARKNGRALSTLSAASFHLGLGEAKEVFEAFQIYTESAARYYLAIKDYNLAVAELNRVAGQGNES